MAELNLKELVDKGDYKLLARTLTRVENDLPGADELLKTLEIDPTIPVIGITGPPGAGKSTLINSLVTCIRNEGKRAAVLVVDPTSPFTSGSLLGDRVRMAEHFTQSGVYIRSIATRGSLGGLSAKAIEMVDVLRSAGFDYILIETVGVGQSEVEIAGLADVTVVVLVPEAGDEIQHIKSGVMEIGDVFVVNKADRDGADSFAHSLRKLLNRKHAVTPVIKTIASKDSGVIELFDEIKLLYMSNPDDRVQLLTEKAWHIIQSKQMKLFNKQRLHDDLRKAQLSADFNLYAFTAEWMQMSGKENNFNGEVS